uniref:Uncharacterized protein n=1 Tax=Sphenodon punctatus TaxID=8508 RepID=A0A8D0GY79_SPHPU
MSLNGGLYACEDPALWTAVFDVYWDVVQAKGNKQKKLLALDKWYQVELPFAFVVRKDKYLTQDELVKLMEWKLARGKFRPRLQQLVATNIIEVVESCTKRAFQLLPDVPAAITELSKLKAVGPATASAILAAGAPEAVAFMADEAMESIPGLTPIQYTLKHYTLYLNKIQGCVKKLNKADSQTVWTPHCVEMCLWAWAVAQKLCPLLLQTLGTGGEKADGETDAYVSSTKRRKTK